METVFAENELPTEDVHSMILEQNTQDELQKLIFDSFSSCSKDKGYLYRRGGWNLWYSFMLIHEPGFKDKRDGSLM